MVREILENNPPANYKDKWGVINVLKEAAANGESWEIVNRHIHNVRNNYG